VRTDRIGDGVRVGVLEQVAAGTRLERGRDLSSSMKLVTATISTSVAPP